MPLSDRQCSGCGKKTCQYGSFCKYCGAEMPLPATMEERREMLKYQIHQVPKSADGSCENIYHFIVGRCGGLFCDQCSKKLDAADARIPEV